AVLLRQHRNGGATAGEVGDHLAGDSLGNCRNPDPGNTVIAGKYPDLNSVQRGQWRPLPTGKIHRQGLQPAQGTRWLGKLVLPFQGGSARRLIDGGYGGLQPG